MKLQDFGTLDRLVKCAQKVVSKQDSFGKTEECRHESKGELLHLCNEYC